MCQVIEMRNIHRSDSEKAAFSKETPLAGRRTFSTQKAGKLIVHSENIIKLQLRICMYN
uniref:Uncharacterized protein n=1 Tax=Anguilla anguilla TaxID=7936 RepID=A0A0E9RIW7_ANGAN